MKIINCEQLSEEWYTARLGMVTASHFSEVLNKGSGHKTYLMKLLAERETSLPQINYSNANMEWGIETEPEGRAYYETLHDVKIETIGFVKMDDDVGASPDGLIDSDGTIEIKCPLPSTHLGYILKGKLPSTYVAQVQGQLWVCNRQWCDFVSFDPRVRKRPYWSLRVERDEEYIEGLAKAVKQFVADLKSLETRLVKSTF